MYIYVQRQACVDFCQITGHVFFLIICVSIFLQSVVFVISTCKQSANITQVIARLGCGINWPYVHVVGIARHGAGQKLVLKIRPVQDSGPDSLL